uniref:Uncharacterized protein n=1 Tax=Onchocerca volvulus TaxID=6282 RepID=A0A8R1TN80_ONCVO
MLFIINTTFLSQLSYFFCFYTFSIICTDQQFISLISKKQKKWHIFTGANDELNEFNQFCNLTYVLISANALK